MDTNLLKELLREQPASICGRNKKTFDFSENSESFTFYNDQFRSENRTYDIGSLRKSELIENAPREMQEVILFLKKNIKKDAVVLEIGGSKFQRRSGFPYYFFENYFPLDISRSSMIEYSEGYDLPSVACNAERLPLKDESVDVVYTHTFLEHAINPDAVVKEIDRVLKNGGYVIHSDSWNCRWWNKYGIFKVKNGRKFNQLTSKEKLLYAVIFISEIKILRQPIVVFSRFLKTFLGIYSASSKLRFKKLSPNYNLHLYTDEDAAASIDPVDLISFYENRGYHNVVGHSKLAKLFFRAKNIYLQKQT